MVIWSPENITAIIVAVIAGGLGALITALLAGRKTKAEAVEKEANAASTYEQLSTRMEDRYSAVLARYDEAQKEIYQLRADVDSLKAQINDKDRTINRLTLRVQELEKQIPTS